MSRNDYQRNMDKEKGEQPKVKDILEEHYKRRGYEILEHELVKDRARQIKGIDRILRIKHTITQEELWIRVDDKAQSSTSLLDNSQKYNHVFIPYLRVYDDGRITEDWATSPRKVTDVVIMTTADNVAILWDCHKLKEAFKEDNHYYHLIDTYGYNEATDEYYTMPNEVEANEEHNGYKYTAYLIYPTLKDILSDPVLKDTIISIYQLSM